jgi:hypothetical protein
VACSVLRVDGGQPDVAIQRTRFRVCRCMEDPGLKATKESLFLHGAEAPCSLRMNRVGGFLSYPILAAKARQGWGTRQRWNTRLSGSLIEKCFQEQRRRVSSRSRGIGESASWRIAVICMKELLAAGGSDSHAVELGACLGGFGGLRMALDEQAQFANAGVFLA